MIGILRWRSFTLVANVDDENDDVQNIAKKLTMSAIARDLCVIVHDNDEEGAESCLLFPPFFFSSFLPLSPLYSAVPNIPASVTLPRNDTRSPRAGRSPICVVDYIVSYPIDAGYTSHVVHIGEPEEKFLREPANATVLIVGEGSSRDRLSRMNSSNNLLLLLLEDFR